MSTNNQSGSRQRSRSSRDSARKPAARRENIEELHPVDAPPDVNSFDEWELGEEVQRAIRNMDITVPTPIQALAIGPVLAGKDVIAKAETGTGKTLAFGAPMIARIDPARSTVLALVLCPTRELAQQVCDVIAALGLTRGINVAFVVGGDPMGPQIAALQGGAQVVVGTPGRVLDLYQQRFLSFPWAECVVLDEADKMFEIGFLDDIKKILSYFPEERQTLLFSATFPTEVLKLARSETTDPVEIATQRGSATVTAIAQKYILLGEDERALALTRLFEQSDPKEVFLVFCDRRTEVDRLLRRLERLPFSIKALHGGYDQPSRYRVMSAFRTGEVKALLATDVASRGLDVEHVSHVINYSVPRDGEDYTHRIGRTGRAGRTGTAITFVTPADQRRLKQLISQTKYEIEEIEVPQRHGRQSGPGRAREGGSRRPESRTPDRSRARDSADTRSEEPRGERPRERAREAGGRDEPRREGSPPRRASRQRPEVAERDQPRPRVEGSAEPESREAPAQSRTSRGGDRPRRPRREDGERPAESGERADRSNRSERPEPRAPRPEEPRETKSEEPQREPREREARRPEREEDRSRGGSRRGGRGREPARREPGDSEERPSATATARPRPEPRSKVARPDAGDDRPVRRTEEKRPGSEDRDARDRSPRTRPAAKDPNGKAPKRAAGSEGKRGFGAVADPGGPDKKEEKREPRRRQRADSAPEKPATPREEARPDSDRPPGKGGFGAGI